METYNERSGWRIIAANPKGLNIVHQKKGETEKMTPCISLWENDTDYLLSFKNDSHIVLEKADNVSIRFTKVV